MYNTNKPSVDELPSSMQLLRSTAIAIVAAAAILVTIVLPSEYGIDPTGIGGLLGLSTMGEIKVQLAEEADADRRLASEVSALVGASGMLQSAPQTLSERIAAPESVVAKPVLAEPISPEQVAPAVQVSSNSTPEAEIWRDEISIALAPGQGTEVKLVMEAGSQARYEWTADGGTLNYDTHGDGGGRSISYEKGRGVSADQGVLEAAFDGNHGWFWRNRTSQPVTVTLRTQGVYSELKRML